jgi:hypothetical protein
MRRQKREFMWRRNDSEEAIGEEFVEVDHAGSWMEFQEKILSKWIKFNLFLIVLSHL